MQKTKYVHLDLIQALIHQDLENSIRSCTVKINFEKSDELLSRINADNDTIYIKLASNLEVSAEFVNQNIETNNICMFS